MAGHSLNTVAQLMCPHGGLVQIVSSNMRTSAGGAPLALAADVYTVVGCTFLATTPTPSPCVLVQWMVTDSRVKVNSLPTLSRSSVGLCVNALQVPQGPVSVVTTQVRAQSL